MRLQFTAIPPNVRLIKLKSTKDFKPFGISAPDVPLILDRRTMRLEEPPTMWLIDTAVNRGRTRSPRTWDTYADNVLDWLRNCDENNWNYLDPVEGWLGAYCRHMLTSQTVDEAPFKTATINLRLNTVCRFYLWLARNRYIDAYPFSAEEGEANSYLYRDEALAHARSASITPRRTATLPSKKSIPRAMNIAVLVKIRPLLPEREQLIFDWAIACGLRLSEILAIRLIQLPNTRLVRNTLHIDITFTETKGLKPRTLAVPVRLVDRTRRYIDSSRASIALTTQESLNPYVFLAEPGRQVSRKTVHKIFRDSVKKIGLSLRFHDLRHTWAIHRLSELERNRLADPNAIYIPIKVLQRELGHTYMSSTQIYLDAVGSDAGAAESALNNLLDSVGS